MEPHSKVKRYRHLFGPVNSRRLGLSLGVDLVPYKYCPLNCVYCEVQSTTHLITVRNEYIPIDEILEELDHFLASHPPLNYITFSGAGEPTLNIGFGRVVKHIKSRYPEYKLALLTNGTLLHDPVVKAEALPCDLVLPSLDSATQRGYEIINRPQKDLLVQELIDSLIAFRQEYEGEMWLEVFIIAGINDSQEELIALSRAISQIRPDKVQLNALDRPGAEEWVQAAPLSLLQEIKAFFQTQFTTPVEIIAKAAAHLEYEGSADMLAQIASTLQRRPSTAEDLAITLGTHINEVSKLLRELNTAGKVEHKREERGVFYLWKA